MSVHCKDWSVQRKSSSAMLASLSALDAGSDGLLCSWLKLQWAMSWSTGAHTSKSCECGDSASCEMKTLTEPSGPLTSKLLLPIFWTWMRRSKAFQVASLKLPFVIMSAACDLVPTKRMLIVSFLAMRSMSQSKLTLWVRETCFIAGILCLLHILMTASLSSKMMILARSIFLWKEGGT